jgi:SH3-like domain-containing protein
VPKHWRVTGVAANAVLMVRSGPRDEAPVVFVYSPRATCIVYLGNCQKPWCQVQYPSDQGPRTGWVDARFLTPSNESCGG